MSWTRVADLSDFGDKTVIGVVCQGRRLALYRLDDGIYATAGVCTHAAAPLSDGEVVEGFVECPAHFGLFDIRTGQAQGAPVTRDLRTYPVKVEDGSLFVELDDPA